MGAAYCPNPNISEQSSEGRLMSCCIENTAGGLARRYRTCRKLLLQIRAMTCQQGGKHYRFHDDWTIACTHLHPTRTGLTGCGAALSLLHR